MDIRKRVVLPARRLLFDEADAVHVLGPEHASASAAQPLVAATGRDVDYVHTALTPIMIPGNASHIGGMRHESHGRRLKNLSRTRNACTAWCKRSNNNTASA